MSSASAACSNVGGSWMPCERSSPTICRDRASICSIADTSTPAASLDVQVSRARRRRSATSPRAAVASEQATSARHCAGRRVSTRNVADVTTPSVPSAPMKEIDEVHAGSGEVPGRQLCQRWHAVAGHRHPHAPARQIEFEIPVRMRPCPAPLDVQHVAIGQYDRQRLDPVARRAVLERRGARRVGRDDPADEGAREGRHGRVRPARLPQMSLPEPPGRRRPARELDRWIARSMRVSLPVLSTTSPRGVAPPVSDDCAPTARTLADAAFQDLRDAGLGFRYRDARSVAARKMGRILDETGEKVRIARNLNGSAGARRAIVDSPAHASASVQDVTAALHSSLTCALRPSMSARSSTRTSRMPRSCSSRRSCPSITPIW